MTNISLRYNISPVTKGADLIALYGQLSALESQYPNFRDWYFKKVAPGVGDGSRKAYAVSVGDSFAGALILKCGQEKKICTLRVSPAFQGHGIGHGLIEKAIAELKDPFPLITVSDDYIEQFKPLLKEYDFTLCQFCLSYYRDKHTEYVYNGLLVDGKNDRNFFDTSPIR